MRTVGWSLSATRCKRGTPNNTPWRPILIAPKQVSEGDRQRAGSAVWRQTSVETKLRWRQNSSDPNQLMTAAPDYRRNTITVIYKVLPLLAYTKNTHTRFRTHAHTEGGRERGHWLMLAFTCDHTSVSHEIASTTPRKRRTLTKQHHHCT